MRLRLLFVSLVLVAGVGAAIAADAGNGAQPSDDDVIPESVCCVRARDVQGDPSSVGCGPTLRLA